MATTRALSVEDATSSYHVDFPSLLPKYSSTSTTDVSSRGGGTTVVDSFFAQ